MASSADRPIVIEAATSAALADPSPQARSQFASDSRIEEVTQLVVDDSEGDRLIVRALLKPVAGAAFRVSVPVSQSQGA